MGMSKEQKALYAQMTAMLAQMQNPKSNPAQEWLTNEALQGAEYMKRGEFSTLPKGMFFDFKMPAEDIKKYKKLTNVGQGGTFALARNGESGRGKAQALQGKYLSDRFARDTMQNYQDNISNASKNIRGGLQQASGYQTNQQGAIMNALQSTYQNAPKGFSWGGLLGGIGSMAGSFI